MLSTEGHGSASALPSSLTSRLAISQEIDLVVAELRARSYSPGIVLEPEAIREIESEARLRRGLKNRTGVIHGNYDSISEAERAEIAIFTIHESSEIPVIGEIAGDPLVFDVARRFLGYRPREVSTWLFWSLANDMSPSHRQSFQTVDFHYDVDGFNFLYLNFYITATDRSSGAHGLIPGSHRGKSLRHLLGSARRSDSETASVYGPSAEAVIEGPAGYGFFEDASCFHRAHIPADSDRLMLQLRIR
ncbi:hypothetical protein OAG46_00415 [Planctomycetota bacterium]|nr:hypothetical protein [bacterium]MDB4780239.1 hypothetical protein [Planctomycetota bacterium]